MVTLGLTMGVSSAQAAQFAALGVLHLPAVFSAAEVAELRAAMERLCASALGRPMRPGDHVWEAPFVERSAELLPLVGDERILGPVRAVLGNDAVWAGSEGMWGARDPPATPRGDGSDDAAWRWQGTRRRG